VAVALTAFTSLPPLSLVPAPASWPPRAAPLPVGLLRIRPLRCYWLFPSPSSPASGLLHSLRRRGSLPCIEPQDPVAPGLSPVAEPLLPTPPIPSSPAAKPLLPEAPPPSRISIPGRGA
ncbi:unnamed protein product, partial [Urochloa humidicola]